MIADRLLAYLHERLGFVVTRWSLVRIAGFAVLGLLLASVVVPARPGDTATAPYNSTLASTSVRNVALPLGDTRGFLATSRPRDFRVAWIGGSETLAVGAKTRAFIPRLVTETITTVDGAPVSTDIYYLNAIRVADELSALSTALSTKPDLVVVSLNPVWVLNDLAVQQWGYLDGALARDSLWPPSRWAVAASLLSPGDAGWRLLSRVAPSAVGDRFDWGVDIAEGTGGLTFLDEVSGATPAPPSGLGLLATRRPVDFWNSYFEPSNKGTSVAIRQLGILERETGSRSSLNRAVVQEMFEMVERSGTAAYFYVPPINPTVYAEPDAQKYVAELRSGLASATSGLTSASIVFDSQGLQDRVPPTAYRDIVHVLDGRPEAAVLSADLCALITAVGRQPGCEGP